MRLNKEIEPIQALAVRKALWQLTKGMLRAISELYTPGEDEEFGAYHYPMEKFISQIDDTGNIKP